MRVEVRDHRPGGAPIRVTRLVRVRARDSLSNWSGGPARPRSRDAGSPDTVEPVEAGRFAAANHSVARDGPDVVVSRHSEPIDATQQFGGDLDGYSHGDLMTNEDRRKRDERQRVATEDRADELRARDRRVRDHDAGMLRSMNQRAKAFWAGR